MNKKDFPILEPDRIRMVIECAGNEKLSEFPFEKIEKVLADKEIPDRIVYVYLYSRTGNIKLTNAGIKTCYKLFL